MKWCFSVNVGINTNLFPAEELSDRLKKPNDITIDINQNFYPTDGELGMLASIVYEEHRAILEESQALTRSQRMALEGAILADQEERIPIQLKHFFEEWLCVFRFIEKESGYSGALYIHKSLPQLVIANEGTRTPKQMMTDVREPASLMVGEKTEVSAIADFITQLNGVLQEFPHYALSITGHSLGGWLSLISTFIAEEKNLHVHTVTFDSPGAMPMLQKRQPEVSSGVGIGTLDIKTILSNVNLVNVCHTHAPGTIRVFPLLQGITGSKDYLLKSHDILRILEQFNNQGNLPIARYQIVDNWPSIKPQIKDVKTQSFSFILLQTAYRAAKTAVEGGFSEYNAFFDCFKRHNIPYDHTEGLLAIMDQGERDAMAYGSAHYATSEENPYRTRLANLNESERNFLEFLYLFRLNIPQIDEWLNENNFLMLANVVQRIEIQKQFIFKVTGEVDPHIILKNAQPGEEQYLGKLINEIHHLIRKFPEAENAIRIKYKDAFEQLSVQVHEVIPKQFQKIMDLMQAHITPSQMTKIGTFKAAAGDFHSQNTFYRKVPDALALKMYEMKLAQDNKSREQDARSHDRNRSSIDKATVESFKQYIHAMTNGREIGELFTAFGDMYLNDTEIEIGNVLDSSSLSDNQTIGVGERPNPF